MSDRIHTMPVERRDGIAGRHIVTSGRPAQFRRDALISGNGMHRLRVFGNPTRETIVLNQEDLYLPNWKTPPTAPDCADVLDDVRRQLLEGKYEEASYRAMYRSLSNGVSDCWYPAPAHVAFILRMDQRVRGEARDYLRSVDLRSGVISVCWSDDDGCWLRRSLVPRTPDDVAFTWIDSPDGLPIDLRLSVETLYGAAEVQALDDCVPQVSEIAWGEPNWHASVDKTARLVKRPSQPDVKMNVQSDTILVTGEYDPQYMKGGYSAVLSVRQEGGSATVEDNRIVIRGAKSVILLMKAAAFPKQSPQDDKLMLEHLYGIDADFDAVVQANSLIHGAMFSRLELDLDAKPDDYLLTTEELLEKQRLSQGINAVLIEKMVDMGRYFLLYNSGKWPPLYGHVNINVNHQISGASIGSLPEMLDVFLRWIERQLPDARENARLVFGARGFLIACHPDIESGKLYHFNHLYPHHYWISGSGWCLQPFLEHYYCTGDDTFLKERMLPLYAELAKFYEDYLKLTDEQGQWVFAPSYSPENWPSNTLIQTAINATMDITVCREVMDVLLNFGPKVGFESSEQIASWQAIRDRLPQYLVDVHGELKEWAWHGLEERYDHRHLSHLYGAYPGDEFQPENDPAIYKAAFLANRMRAQENSSAHGIAHRAQIAARLKDPYFVFQNTKQLLETGFVNDSFSTRHNPYVSDDMPDAQGALVSIVLESLMYSRPGVIELLPALPWCWPKGSLKGFSARTAVRVEELSWNLPSGEIRLELFPLQSQRLMLRYRTGFDGVSVDGAHLIDTGDCWCRLELERGRRADIKVQGAHRT